MITLVLGGARSGKSEVAERLASRLSSPVTYVATMDEGRDTDLAARVARHRDRRPTTWRTLEVGADLTERVHVAGAGTLLVDALGPWVAAHEGCLVDSAALVAALRSHDGDVVVVSEEVGLGVHPSSEAGRVFRDALGEVNRAVAEAADEVLLVIAGRVLPLERSSDDEPTGH